MTLELSKSIRERLESYKMSDPDKKIVVGRGKYNKPEFLIFGEAPGKKENEKGVP